MQNLQLHSRKDMAFISVHGEDQNVYGCDTFGPFSRFMTRKVKTISLVNGSWLTWKLCSSYEYNITAVQAMVDGNNEEDRTIL